MYIDTSPCNASNPKYYFIILQMLTDLGTFLTKAIPDTRLTIKKYADAKFEYLVCTTFSYLVNLFFCFFCFLLLVFKI